MPTLNRSFQGGGMDPWEFWLDSIDGEKMVRDGTGMFYTMKAFHKLWNSSEVSKPGAHSVVHLCRQGVEPTPEHARNAPGMQIIFDCVQKQKAFHVLWVDVVLVLVTGGDMGLEATRAINGVSAYPDLHTIHIWLKTDNTTVRDAVMKNLVHAVPVCADAEVSTRFLVNAEVAQESVNKTPQNESLNLHPLMAMSFSPAVCNHSFSEMGKQSGVGRRSRSLPPVGDRPAAPQQPDASGSGDAPTATDSAGNEKEKEKEKERDDLLGVARVASMADPSRSNTPSPTHAHHAQSISPPPQGQYGVQSGHLHPQGPERLNWASCYSGDSFLAGGIQQAPSQVGMSLGRPTSSFMQPAPWAIGGDAGPIAGRKHVSFHQEAVDHRQQYAQHGMYPSSNTLQVPGGAHRRTHSAGAAGDFNGRYQSCVPNEGRNPNQRGLLQHVESWEDPDWTPPSMAHGQGPTHQAYVDPRTITYDGGFFPTPAQVQDNLEGFLDGSLPMSGIKPTEAPAQKGRNLPRSQTGNMQSNFLNPAFCGYGRAPFDWKEGQGKGKNKQYGLYHAVSLTLVAKFCRDTYLPPPVAAELRSEEAASEKIEEDEVKYSKSRSPRNRRKIRERKIREAAESTRREMRIWCPLYGTPPLAWVSPKENKFAVKPDAFSEEDWWRFVQACRKNNHAVDAVAALPADVLVSLGMPEGSAAHEEALRAMQHGGGRRRTRCRRGCWR
eukprot:TRINITY_DN2832_c1_g1_i3.p1 TRINITY_DN2832_c1_g1~~TRINITY_DN2832_c1_g1_i3.p1  ORF type:complete len:779 (+),score=145.13 TRINITY_DN2832_c1_g1_i3:181-2337(+)